MPDPNNGPYADDAGEGAATSTEASLDVAPSVDDPSDERDPVCSIHVRPLETLAEYRACVALQKETWGQDFSEVVPLALLKVGQRIGGVTAGAFDDQGQLLGFVFGLTGVEDGGRVVHWSDMLAVRRDMRNQGIGRRLKEFQRTSLQAHQVEVIYWTFDPLVARNAHLNLNRLGARVIEYIPDMYGTTDSPLHRGLGTDRFIVAWSISDDPSAGRAPAVDAPLTRPVCVIDSERPETVDIEPVRTGTHLVEVRIPSDIQKVQAASLERAAAWRQGTRAALTGLIGMGYRVAGFRRHETTGECGYLLAPNPSSPEAA